MFTAKDYSMIFRKEFIILHKTKFYVEFMSKSTKHCWMIYKHGSPDIFPVWMYHKHRQMDSCYHLHRRKMSVVSSIKEILQHDQYILSDRKQIFKNQK